MPFDFAEMPRLIKHVLHTSGSRSSCGLTLKVPLRGSMIIEEREELQGWFEQIMLQVHRRTQSTDVFSSV